MLKVGGQRKRKSTQTGLPGFELALLCDVVQKNFEKYSICSSESLKFFILLYFAAYSTLISLHDDKRFIVLSK